MATEGVSNAPTVASTADCAAALSRAWSAAAASEDRWARLSSARQSRQKTTARRATSRDSGSLIMGAPPDMQVCAARKGVLQAKAEGRPCQSGRPTLPRQEEPHAPRAIDKTSAVGRSYASALAGHLPGSCFVCHAGATVACMRRLSLWAARRSFREGRVVGTFPQAVSFAMPGQPWLACGGCLCGRFGAASGKDARRDRTARIERALRRRGSEARPDKLWAGIQRRRERSVCSRTKTRSEARIRSTASGRAAERPKPSKRSNTSTGMILG